MPLFNTIQTTVFFLICQWLSWASQPFREHLLTGLPVDEKSVMATTVQSPGWRKMFWGRKSEFRQRSVERLNCTVLSRSKQVALAVLIYGRNNYNFERPDQHASHQQTIWSSKINLISWADKRYWGPQSTGRYTIAIFIKKLTKISKKFTEISLIKG